MMPKRYFAVRVGNWVDIREALKPPKEITSETIIKIKHRYYDYWNNRYYIRTEPKQLKQTIYKGGKTLATIKTRNFATKTQFTVGKGKMVELIPAVALDLIQERG